jgi:hypothetical protein
MDDERVIVRRARRKDVSTIVGIINSTRWLSQPITADEALIRLLRKGLWLAISRNGAALAGWQIENLVTCVDDFYVYPPQAAGRLGPPLLESVERAARELQCEVAAIKAPEHLPKDLETMLSACGYSCRPVEQLDKIWREVLGQFMPGQPSVWVKQLRADRVVMPI